MPFAVNCTPNVKPDRHQRRRCRSDRLGVDRPGVGSAPERQSVSMSGNKQHPDMMCEVFILAPTALVDGEQVAPRSSADWREADVKLAQRPFVSGCRAEYNGELKGIR
jgi:hypothetical protein